MKNDTTTPAALANENRKQLAETIRQNVEFHRTQSRNDARPAVAKTAIVGSSTVGIQMTRRQFNSYLAQRYGCKHRNDVVADCVYEGDDFHVEIFLNSPDGLLVAVHHGFAGLNFQKVQVMRPSLDLKIADVEAA